IECSPATCSITNLVVDPLDCNDDGTYDFFLNFEALNPGNQFFDLFLNGNFIGFYPLADLPLTITGINGNNSGGDFVEVCINDNPNCCAATDFVAPICNNNCEISAIEVYPLTCNADGSYSLLVDLTHNNNTGSFNVFNQNGVLGTYLYADLPIIIPAFQSNGDLIQHLGVCDNAVPNCCIDTEFEGLICDNCEYWDIEVSPEDCLDDGTFPITLNFNHLGGGTSFTVLSNGQNWGIFNYSDLPITFGAFNGDGSSTYNLVVVDLTNPFCNFSWSFEAIECGNISPATAVWPGDANNDNIANHLDLLNVALAYELEGPERPVGSIVWEGLAAFDWEGTFVDGTNHKYADCDGDGLVDSPDLIAIESNYGLTHGPVEPFSETIGTPNDPSLFVDLSAVGELQAGVPFVAPIILGVESLPVDALYGLAFTIEFDPALINVEAASVEVASSWLGTPGENLISINKTLVDEGQIEVAISRIDHNSVGGHGPIAHFIGIIDDVLGNSEMKVVITKIKAIQEDESPVFLYNPVKSAQLDQVSSVHDLSNDFTVFPNPSNHLVTIKSEGQHQVQHIRIYNLLGQMMQQIPQATALEQIDVSNWTSGIYFIHLEVGTQTKIVKLMVE
ncbi:MAG: T9SS type A sorting domain-containing protein, partial [Bacteroidota bacterium]